MKKRNIKFLALATGSTLLFACQNQQTNELIEKAPISSSKPSKPKEVVQAKWNGATQSYEPQRFDKNKLIRYTHFDVQLVEDNSLDAISPPELKSKQASSSSLPLGIEFKTLYEFDIRDKSGRKIDTFSWSVPSGDADYWTYRGIEYSLYVEESPHTMGQPHLHVSRRR